MRTSGAPGAGAPGAEEPGAEEPGEALATGVPVGRGEAPGETTSGSPGSDTAEWAALWWTVDQLQARLTEAVDAQQTADADERRYPLDAWQDTGAYRRWLAERQQLGLDELGLDDLDPRDPVPGPSGQAPVAVLVWIGATDANLLRESVESIVRQTHDGWQLYLVGAIPQDRLVHDAVMHATSHPRVTHVDALPADRPAEHGCTWVIVLEPGDLLAPCALARLATVAATTPDADVVYADEDSVDVAGQRSHPVFKPQWAPDLLLSCPYLGRMVFVRHVLWASATGPTWTGAHEHRDNAGAAVDAWYELLLAVTERARRIVHLPFVLYHRRLAPTRGWYTGLPESQEAGRHALERALRRRDDDAYVEDGLVPGTYRVRRPVRGEPLVSIIIPFRDQAALLRACVDSLESRPGYGHFELVLVDNDSAEPETQALLDRLVRRPGYRLVRCPGAFNWSAINNAAVAACDGDLLLFLNNDIEARQPDWLSAMVEHAQRPGIGAVGARLLYPNATVQHVGTILGLGVIAAHLMPQLPAGQPGYLGFANVTREYSAVTAAAMMCRRDVFEDVGGFDEQLAIGFNDVDFCMRLTAAGYRILFTPYAELVHHESLTRGFTGFYNDYQLYLRRWQSRLRPGDPFFSPNLSRLDSHCVVRPPDEDGTWNAALSRLMSSSPS